MLLTFIELILLVAGAWALIRGKIPSFVIGGADYVVEGPGARFLGLLLTTPFLLSVLTVILLVLAFGEEAALASFWVEIPVLILVAVATLVGARLIRKPLAPEAIDLELVIERKATGSLIYSILGLLGFVGIVLGPLAFYRAGQALELIEAHGIGQKHRNNARTARKIAAVETAIWVLVLLGILISALPGILM